MNEKATIGIVGATYENRLNGKRGRFVEFNESTKSVKLTSEEGTEYFVNVQAFKNNWRKVADVLEVSEPEEEPCVDCTLCEPETTDNSDECAGQTFDCSLKAVERDIKIKKEDDTTTVTVEGVAVLRVADRKTTRFVQMLPDIFTHTDWKNFIDNSTLSFRVGTVDRMSVSFETHASTTDILQVVECAVSSINLYGYK